MGKKYKILSTWWGFMAILHLKRIVGFECWGDMVSRNVSNYCINMSSDTSDLSRIGYSLFKEKGVYDKLFETLRLQYALFVLTFDFSEIEKNIQNWKSMYHKL